MVAAHAPVSPEDTLDAVVLPPATGRRLDELLGELLERAGELQGTQQRFNGLLDAVVAVGGDLNLPDVLTRIVQAACTLSGARYGALGVVDEGDPNVLVEFVTVGLEPAEHARIGDLPRGHGVLGVLLRRPEPLRLSAISDHSDSAGFPPNHPAMDAFLGVPMRVRGRIFGNLYLTEKAGGRPFTQEDEDLVVALATAAAVAVDNARLFGEVERRQRWLVATTEITQALAFGTDEQHALQLVIERAVASSGASGGALLLSEGESLTVSYAVGALAGAEEAGLHTASGPLQEAMTGRVVAVPSASDLPAALAPDDGSALLLPLVTAGGVRGILELTTTAGGSFTESDTVLAAAFATQAAVGLELARARTDRERLLVLEDRNRIARDLHDLVIQRLFATGLSLQAVAQRISGSDAADRVERSVEDIDTTIRDLRHAIFSLRNAGPRLGLRAAIDKEVRRSVDGLGLEPRLRLDGPLDLVVSHDLGSDVLAVIRESLSNAAKHARCRSIDLHVSLDGGQVTIVVQDDGVGFDPTAGPRSGLDNLRVRAEKRGGSFAVDRAEPTGTRLVWQVPLDGLGR